jgi:biotin transport system substrate-specific component
MPMTQTTGRTWPLPASRTTGWELSVGLALVLLTAVAAQIRIPLPFTPVPLTFQVLVVLSAGYLLRPLAAAGAMSAYLLLGAAGAPVFSGAAAGAAVLSGLTGGYLLAMPLAALLVSLLVRRGPGTAGRILAGAAGLAVIHLSGALWLAGLSGSAAVGVAQILAWSFLPFLAIDLLKLATAEWLTRPPHRIP